MDAINKLTCHNGNDNGHLLWMSNEGTSARTRPFSFEEILSRRKSKKEVDEAVVESDQHDELNVRGETVQAEEHSSFSDVLEPRSMPEDPVRTSLNVHDLKEPFLPHDGVKGSSKQNTKTKHDIATDVEIKRSMEKKTLNKHTRSGRTDHHRRASESFQDEYEQEFHKKHRKDISSKVVDMERGRMPEREIWLPSTVNRIRIKSEIDTSGLRRHDIRQLPDSEFSEKRGQRYGEPVYKKRRSRSREHDRRKGRFSPMSPRELRYSNQRSPSVSPRRRRRHNRSPSFSPKRLHRMSVSLSPRVQRFSKQRSPVSPRMRRRHNRRSPSVSPKKPHRLSASISPRAHKHSHHRHNGHDHGGESLFHSSRGRSEKKNSESDRTRDRKSTGSSRQHDSEFGGYSPRKRKTETAAKIPSPTHHSPDRKVATWDQPPVSTIANTQSIQLLTIKANPLPSSTPIAATTVKALTTPLSNVPILPLDMSVDSIQLTQATRPKRRLYIENLPSPASDKDIIEWLNGFLRSYGVSRFHGNSPCISCIMNKDKCQAVVEFLTPEDATSALSLNGKSFLGSILKIRRPKDYVDAPTVIEDKAPEKLELSQAVSTVVEDSSQKIFIGGISKALTSGMLMEIVRSFGTLKAFQFDVNEFGEPHVFVEYLDPGVTLSACNGLNGMKLGGQVLTVVKAFPDANIDELKSVEESILFKDVPLHAKPLLMNPTKVLQLKNVFNMEEFMLLPDPELEEILEDVRLECARFGTVKSINAIRQVVGDSAIVFEENPLTVPTEIAVVDYPLETNTELMEDGVAFDVQSNMKNLENPFSVGKNLENETGNPSEDNISNPSPPLNVVRKSHSDDLEFEDPAEDLQIPVLEAQDTNSTRSDLASEEQRSSNVEMDKVDRQNATDPHVERVHVDEEKVIQGSDAHAFEPGCILVEFAREEAACMAAHCLNGRSYDGRCVEISYVAHEFYLEQFPH